MYVDSFPVPIPTFRFYYIERTVEPLNEASAHIILHTWLSGVDVFVK